MDKLINMDKHRRREFVVVGAGLLGLGASGALASLGRDVLCLDLAEVGHAWSGSKGNSRAFRYNYDEPMLNAMVAEAERTWRDLETASGLRILEPTPFLNFGEDLTGYAARVAAAGGAVEYLEADAVASRFPALAIRGPAVLETTAGMIRADRARDALRAGLRAELREGVEVTAVLDGPDSVRVETTDGDIEADQVVVCAGPGTAPLLRGMGLDYRVRTSLQQIVYLAVPPAQGAGQWPAVVRLLTAGEDDQLYALPLPDFGQYKFGVRYSGPEVTYRQTPLNPDPAVTRRLVAAAATLLRDVGSQPRLVEQCVLDYTADLHFVLDRVGRVVVGAGTSGHGFKFGPLLGSLIADLAVGAVPRWDLTAFSLRRPALTAG
jgi:sarcosine oxidase